MQTSYAQAVASFGIERGVIDSRIDYVSMNELYAQTRRSQEEAERLAREELSAKVRIEPPGHMVARPQEYAAQQQERVTAAVMPTVEAMARRAQVLEHKVMRQDRFLADAAERQRAYKSMVGDLRRANLETVMSALGGQRDRYDKRKWHLGHEVISINAEKFYNHSRQQGGGGAIDLVMHTTNYSFNEAVAYLRQEVGFEAAVHHAARYAQEVAEREPMPPFKRPDEAPEKWPQVRTYLIQERALSAHDVDLLHSGQRLYADHRGNAVFLRTDEKHAATGAYLRGTGPGSTYAGLAPGTRREAGWFNWLAPGPEREQRQVQLIVAESPIDALSALEIYRRSPQWRDVYQVTIASTDGMGALPKPLIEKTLKDGGIVRVATDNDPAGERLWESIRDQYGDKVVRDRPILKDWNDVLREPERARQELDNRERMRQRSPSPIPHPPSRERKQDRRSRER